MRKGFENFRVGNVLQNSAYQASVRDAQDGLTGIFLRYHLHNIGGALAEKSGAFAAIGAE